MTTISKENLNPELKPEKLTKRDVFFSWFWFFLGITGSQSYSRYGGNAWGAGFASVLPKLYKKKEDLSEAMLRQNELIITEYTFGATIGGLCVSLEEQRANDLYYKGESEITPEFIRTIKAGLMGPFAGFGDTISQGILNVMGTIIGHPLAMQGNILGSLIQIAFAGFPQRWVLSPLFWKLGYEKGQSYILSLLQSKQIKKLLEITGILSMCIMGAMSSTYVKFNMTWQFNGKAFADILENILPGYQGLIPTFIVYYLIKKNVKVTYIIFGMIAISILAALLHLVG